MVAGLEGKMLATPVPPLVIEIGPGGANADLVFIFRLPPGDDALGPDFTLLRIHPAVEIGSLTF